MSCCVWCSCCCCCYCIAYCNCIENLGQAQAVLLIHTRLDTRMLPWEYNKNNNNVADDMPTTMSSRGAALWLWQHTIEWEIPNYPYIPTTITTSISYSMTPHYNLSQTNSVWGALGVVFHNENISSDIYKNTLFLQPFFCLERFLCVWIMYTGGYQGRMYSVVWRSKWFNRPWN